MSRELLASLAEVRIVKKDSELERRECIFWVEFATRQFYIKRFSKINTLSGKILTKENQNIFVNNQTKMIQRQSVKEP